MADAQLANICTYRTELATEIDPATYVTTESMLPNKAGLSKSVSSISSNKAHIYHCGDTLISNIRPYFKKIWQATNDGTCSADVLVFKPNNCDSDYLYWVLSDDSFFNYISATSKGTKMPRGDKSAIMAYPIISRKFDCQKQIAAVLNPLREAIALNNQLNDYLNELGEAIIHLNSHDSYKPLSDICFQVEDMVSYNKATIETYVSTENLLPNKAGKTTASSLPSTGKVKQYKCGDILVSNIRPYFKKIWYAFNDGTCSGDIIVFRSNDNQLSAYLYFCLRQDSFYAYIMSGAKGTKMPRGDKKQMMNFSINSCYTDNQLDYLQSAVKTMWNNESESENLRKLRDTLLPKLMSGEIDTTQLNNHLSDY